MPALVLHSAGTGASSWLSAVCCRHFDTRAKVDEEGSVVRFMNAVHMLCCAPCVRYPTASPPSVHRSGVPPARSTMPRRNAVPRRGRHGNARAHLKRSTNVPGDSGAVLPLVVQPTMRRWQGSTTRQLGPCRATPCIKLATRMLATCIHHKPCVADSRRREKCVFQDVLVFVTMTFVRSLAPGR